MMFEMCQLVAILVMFNFGAPASAFPTSDDVLRVARTFADGGGYSKQWKGTGTPAEIRFKGETILVKGTEGSYCCGFTFTVAMKTATELHALENKSVAQIKRFQKEWYGALKETAERQAGQALANLGVGYEVKPEDAMPGDFCQFWRTKSGHSVIFLDWITRDGKRIGLRYRSSQGSTDGVGDKSEFFKDSGVEGGEVDPSRMYFGRFGAQVK